MLAGGIHSYRDKKGFVHVHCLVHWLYSKCLHHFFAIWADKREIANGTR